MNKKLLVLGAMLSLCMASMSGAVTREGLVQFADKANKARFIQNLILPLAAIAYEHNNGTLSATKADLLKIADELFKNPGMAVNLALEEDPPLAVLLSDAIANCVLINKPHRIGALNKYFSAIGMVTDSSFKRSLITAAVTSFICDVLSILARYKINQWINKEGSTDQFWMTNRRLLRIQAFICTKILSHLVIDIAVTLAADKNGLQPSNTEISDTLIPALNYIFAEFEGHYLAQLLLEAEKEAKAAAKAATVEAT